MARRSESLRRFNYSPGEDDSRWLNSLEEGGENRRRRRIRSGGGGRRRRGGLAQRWKKRGNDGRRKRKRSGLNDLSACCEGSGDCGARLSQVRCKIFLLTDVGV